MELECKKDELREMIDMIESEETANRVGKYLKRMLTREQPPCQYTIEELKERLEEAEEDFRMGRYYTTEEVRAYKKNTHTGAFLLLRGCSSCHTL